MALMAVVLAAGQGTRMKSDLPKVAHRAAGRPLVEWVVGALENLSPERTVVVLGPESDAVSRLLPGWCEVAIQDPPRGTGDAAAVGLAALPFGPPPLRNCLTRSASSSVRLASADPLPVTPALVQISTKSLLSSLSSFASA